MMHGRKNIKLYFLVTTHILYDTRNETLNIGSYVSREKDNYCTSVKV